MVRETHFNAKNLLEIVKPLDEHVIIYTSRMLTQLHAALQLWVRYALRPLFQVHTTY